MKILSRGYKTDMGRLNWCNLPGAKCRPEPGPQKQIYFKIYVATVNQPPRPRFPPPPSGPREAICWLKKKELSAGLSA